MSKVPEVTKAEKQFDCHDPDEGHTTGYFTTVEGHDAILATIEKLTEELDAAPSAELVLAQNRENERLETAFGELNEKYIAAVNGGQDERDARLQAERALASLRSQHERDGRLIGDLVNHMRWWAAQEDGLPPEVYETFNAAMLRLGWSYSTEVDLAALEEESRE